MNNKLAIISVCTVLFALMLGCSSINPFSDKAKDNSTPSNKTLTDKAVDTTVGEQKIGVPECDEVMDILSTEMNNPDDNFVVKAGKALVLNKIKESIKESIEKNKNDKVELAKKCREAKIQLDKYKAEEDKKKAQ